jgi:hypothetical protein
MQALDSSSLVKKKWSGYVWVLPVVHVSDLSVPFGRSLSVEIGVPL